MGRPKGVKNRKGHKAGGSKPKEKKLAPGQKTLAFGSSATATDEPPVPPPRVPPAEKTEEDLRKKKQERQKVERIRLKKVLEHPSNRYGSAVVSEDCTGEDSVDDDDDEDDGGYDGTDEEGVKSRYKRSYKAPQGSVIGEYLDSIRDKVAKGDLDTFLEKGGRWIPPKTDPVSSGIGGQPKPDRWYLGACWVYVWLPQRQYSKVVEKRHPCAFCGGCNTESKGLHWRPMFWWEKRVWVLHQRFKCKDPHCCGIKEGQQECTFASIDPRALSKMPTRVAERFEFVTTPGGPGLHQSMMYSFANLITSQIMVGTFVNMINELQSVHYALESCSYYDALADWSSPLFGEESPKTPYSAFGDAGYHSGIYMTVALLASLFNVFMNVQEPYAQAYFEVHPDDGAAGDDSHKFSNKIFVHTNGRCSVQPFTASFTLMNGRGTLALSRMKFTKSHDEMRPILEGLKKSRENAGAPPLKKYETDNVKADKRLFEEIFRFFTTSAAVDNFILAITEELDVLSGNKCYYGLDTEFTRHSPITSVLQVSFHDLPVMVLHLYVMQEFPRRLKDILQSEKFIACGRQIGTDLSP
jgi:hypothetical protein